MMSSMEPTSALRGADENASASAPADARPGAGQRGHHHERYDDLAQINRLIEGRP